MLTESPQHRITVPKLEKEGETKEVGYGVDLVVKHDMVNLARHGVHLFDDTLAIVNLHFGEEHNELFEEAVEQHTLRGKKDHRFEAFVTLGNEFRMIFVSRSRKNKLDSWTAGLLAGDTWLNRLSRIIR